MKCRMQLTCAGMESGIEAAIHAVANKYKESSCEGILFVDAENAFNKLNRQVAINNIQYLCPPMHNFLVNNYKAPTKLFLQDGSTILSREGFTQGDPLAMGNYALSTRHPIETLKEKAPGVLQAWFADDDTALGMLEKLRVYWEQLKTIGPLYGYYPEPSKTVLLVKTSDLLEKAKVLFKGEGVKIKTEGERHLGAVLGTKEFKETYVNAKVDLWVQDVLKLAGIAKEEPQAALSAFNIGLSQRWKYIQRTVADIGHLFQPLEDSIRNELIPALIGRGVSDQERKLFALPYRFGGLGILVPTESAKWEYSASKKITSDLSNLIYHQNMDLSLLDKAKMKERKLEMKNKREEGFKKQNGYRSFPSSNMALH